jgi:hypothetical protein
VSFSGEKGTKEEGCGIGGEGKEGNRGMEKKTEEEELD